MSLILIIISAILLYVAAYQDWKKQEVWDIVTASFTIVCSSYSYINGYHLESIIALSICLIALSGSDLMFFGGADIAMLCGFFALFNLGKMIIFTIVLCLTTIICYYFAENTHFYKKLIKDKRISLICFMAIVAPIFYFI